MLCDEEVRLKLRFKGKEGEDDERLSNTEKVISGDIENQKSKNHDISSMPKKTGFGKFAEGHMIGGIYKLE